MAALSTMYDLKNKLIQHLKILEKKKTLTKCSDQKHVDRIISKSLVCAEKAKQVGNSLFLSSDHDFKVHHGILCCFNESIAYSPSGSEELAAAYANKSALLRHVRKYEESICEADKALKITKSVTLKVKLLCRKAECYTALGSSENRACIQKAKYLVSKFNNAKKLPFDSLINKTQSIVDRGQLDTPKEVKRRTQGIKIVSEAEKLNVWDSITVGYSERHGEHLVAARNFEPGQIVFVEKPYLNIVPDHKAFVYCYHCLKYLWTIVPCDHCAWRAFCSTKCKDEALNEYHNMECSAFLDMSETFSFSQYREVPVIISIFFRALHEVGGNLRQLQTELELVDKCKGGLSCNDKVENFKNIFSLPIRNLEKSGLDVCFKSGAVALSGLARFTKLFGTTYDYNETRKLMRDETAVFVGALLAKYAIIILSRCSQIKPFDPEEKPDKVNFGQGLCVRRKSVGVMPITALSVLSQFTIISCIPNVMKLHTHGNKFLAFAVHPIKKGEQLTSFITTMYVRTPKSKREEIYKELYSRSCDCRACAENWFEAPGSNGNQGIDVVDSKRALVQVLLDESQSIVAEFEKNKCRLNHPDLKLLTRAAKLVAEAWGHFPLPSPVSVNCISLLMEVSVDFYQAVEEHLEFSETCKKNLRSRIRSHQMK